jgi:hypothetical protein
LKNEAPLSPPRRRTDTHTQARSTLSRLLHIVRIESDLLRLRSQQRACEKKRASPRRPNHSLPPPRPLFAPKTPHQPAPRTTSRDIKGSNAPVERARRPRNVVSWTHEATPTREKVGGG